MRALLPAVCAVVLGRFAVGRLSWRQVKGEQSSLSGDGVDL